MTEPAHEHTSGEACHECPIATDRRRFLRDVGIAVAATLVASGLDPAKALAAVVAEIRPLKTRGASLTYSVPAKDAVNCDTDNEVIIARVNGSVHAFSLRCPHKGARLEWRAAEKRIYCPKHKARFNPDGAHFSGRRSRDLDRYAVQLQGREIVIDTTGTIRRDLDPSGWDAAVVSVR